MRRVFVTSWGPRGWTQYGRHFIQGFCRRMPPDCELVVYTEEKNTISQDFAGTRPFQERNLMKVPEVKQFVRQYRDDPAARGAKPQPCWKSTEVRAGYSFRTDAYKFFRKPVAVLDAARKLQEPCWLIWMDADTRINASPPEEAWERLLAPDADVTYLARQRMHSECGWLAFRLPEALPVVESWAELYTSGRFKREKEWHDSYLFDRVRQRSPGVRFRPVNDDELTGHPWLKSPLFPWADHLKGPKRKTRGWSVRTPDQTDG